MKIYLTGAKQKNKDLIVNGSMMEAILALAIPVVINSFLQTMYNLTDTFWLGHLGTDELASINLVSPVQNIVMNFGSGITVAGSVLIAQYIGAKKEEEAGKMASQIYACAMIFAFTAASILFCITPFIVGWLGATENIYTYSIAYLRYVIIDMPLLFTINIFTSVNQAQGDTVKPMLLNLMGILINLVLDPLFMYVFKWGVMGAALATVFAKLPPAIIALRGLFFPKDGIRLSFRNFHFDKSKMADILRIGLPTAIGSSTMQFGFLLMSRNVYVFGKAAMAAYGVGNKCNSLITLPSNGIGSATATIVGQNMGARQMKRADEGYHLAMRISVIFLFIGGIILSRPAISTFLVSIFSEDGEVIGMAADFLSIMALWCFTNGVYNCTSGLFQGTGHTEVTMAVDASRLWVFRFATLFFCQKVLNMGVESVWYSVVVSNGLSAGILYLLYHSNIWRASKIKSLAEA